MQFETKCKEHPEVGNDPDLLEQFFDLDTDLRRNTDDVLFAIHEHLPA